MDAESDRAGCEAGSLEAEPQKHSGGTEPERLAGLFRRSMFWSANLCVSSAWTEHVPFAFWLVDVFRPKTIVELGVHNGMSYSALCQAVKALGLSSRCFGVDTWEGDAQAGFYSEDVYRHFSVFHDQHYAAFSRLVRSTFRDALPHFDDRSIDLLHIDGFHTYEAVRGDFEAWLPKVSANAIVLFHDTNVREGNFGVHRFWEEVRQGRPHFNFLHGHGLGVLGIGRDYPTALKTLFGAERDEPVASDVRQSFCQLGQYVRNWEDKKFISEQDRRIAYLGTERDAAVADVANRLAAQERLVAERDALRAELDGMRVGLGHAKRTAAAMSDESNGVIASLRAELNGVRDQLVSTEERERFANEWLEAVLNSTSWKALAAPRHIARRFPFLAPVIRPLVRGTWRLVRPAFVRPTVSTSLVPREPTVLEDTASPTLPQEVTKPEAVPTHGASGLKQRFQEPMRRALRAFLSSNERIIVVPATEPAISVILVLYNQAHFTLRCLQSLLRESGISIELIIVDNCSTDETGVLLSRIDNATVVRNTDNEGFLLAVNRGAALATGRNLLLLNNDAFVRDGALLAAISTLESAQDIGAVGCRIVLPNGELQEAGSIVFNDGSALGYGRGLPQDDGQAMFRRDVHFCSGAFLLTPRALFNDLGGFDARYAPAYYEEADYCERVRARGKRVVYEPRAVIDHFEFGGQQKEGEAVALQLRNRKIFRDRHHTILTERLPPSTVNVLFARTVRSGQRHVLFIDRQVPLQKLGSGFPRALAMITEIVKAGWFVTFYPTFESDVDWDALYQEIPREVEVCDRGGIAQLAKFLKGRQGFYDSILVSRPENMRVLQAIRQERPDLLWGVRLIYDAEALFSERQVRRARLAGHAVDRATADALMKDELRLCDSVDAVITVTPLEQSVFSAGQGAAVHVLSYPISVPSQSTRSFQARKGFLFVGRLLEKETPNYSGLHWFISEVWPQIRARLPNAELIVAGMLAERHHELEAPGVCLLGAVPDLHPLYDSARVFVAPTRYAAGVPIKVLEAVGAGIPVVSTALIADLLGWTAGREIAVADDPRAFAEAAVSLYQSAGEWEALRDAAALRVAAEHGNDAFKDGIRNLFGGDSTYLEPTGKDYDPKHPVVSVIVLNWNKSQLTLQCLRHLHRNTVGCPFEIVVVDNGSRPEEFSLLAEATLQFRLIRLAQNRYFGEANNIGAEAATGEFICFLNNDAFVQRDWLRPLMEALQTRPRAGGVGPKFLYPDGRLQEAGALISGDGHAIQLGKGGSPCSPEFNKLREVNYISAATFLMRRDVFLRVLGFDLCWEPAYFEDVDLCLKVALLDLAIYYVPESVVVHVENATSLDPTNGLRLDNIVEINRLKFVGRWGEWLVKGISRPVGLLPNDSVERDVSAANDDGVRSQRVALYTPYDLTPGGGERHLLSIAAALASRARVTLVTPEPVSQVRILTLGRELGIDLSRLLLTSYGEGRKMEFDLAFVLGNELLPSISGLGARNIYLCQFPFPMRETETSRRHPFWRQYEQVWVYSPFVKRNVREQMRQHGLVDKTVEILAPPVKMQPYRDQKKAKIMNVGRFFTGWHCKRQDLMIDAFARLVAEGLSEVELHLAGSLHPEPEHRAYFDSLVNAAKGLPVFFHVNCSIEKLASLYEECRIYWHATGLGVDVEHEPEKAEHFGIAVVEAMSAGCVPIVYAAGGPNDLVEHGITGYQFRSIDELCVLTRPALREPNGSEARQIAAAARRSALSYADASFASKVRTRVFGEEPSPLPR